MTDTRMADLGDLALRQGGVLRDARLAYVTRGKLASDGRNAILLTHGYTSSHLFFAGAASAEGSWATLVGPGCAIDTDRYFVVSSNMLGSSYGSTAPGSTNPATGRAYGPDFPELTLADIVTAQMRLLEKLGVRHLVAVVGPSYGGFQAFTWGVEFPDFMRGIVAVVTAPKRNARTDTAALRARLATDPNWNDGHYYKKGGILSAMTALREDTLRRYGLEAALRDRFPGKPARDAEIHRQASAWAEAFDGHSMLALGEAANRYDVSADLAKICARGLYVLCRTDALFPPSLAPGVMAALKDAGVDARYQEIDSENGHLASGVDAAKWEPALRAFMKELD